VALSIDPSTFRGALGRFATGITVVTGLGDESAPIGITVNSFTSVSLDPPLVLFCVDLSSPSCDIYANCSAFALNVLSEYQESISNNFARPLEDKFMGIEYDVWETGCPILKDCLANLECRREAVYDAGDHKIIVGRVEKLAVSDVGHPLLYFRGKYARFGDVR